ncbi:L-asparaginase [Anastrepha ludens]|uniref:L-asparaginase n=1 Tax=Anastrepha ludens TaxID=28586 RepID=UPI0023B0C2AB|nr:L-asparaginase [Anastrepha ludens]XP_053950616.1 L-asparaginase [Anastrepha ludens]XP_053950617.1 L-asparaginase [Anastrepha ludens]
MSSSEAITNTNGECKYNDYNRYDTDALDNHELPNDELFMKLRLNSEASNDKPTPRLCPEATASDNIEVPSMKRNISEGNLLPSEIKEARVRVIYTGGTIGMVRNENNFLAPIPNALVKILRKYPNIHDESYAQERFGSTASMAPLVLPFVQGEKRRVIYQITEYNPLLDSSNMTMQDWARIARDIHQTYEFFDGFVILHGTDTLSYTASALSFMLENLGKTVIITGSQIPIFETRTDGKDNFTSALIIAGNYVIPEVCVFFGNKLMRGNRTVKISTDSLEAFDTPNAASLGRIGLNVEIDYRLIFRPCSISRFSVQTNLDENVGILRIFPSISRLSIRAFLAPPMKGVVLQSFGSGNVPSNRKDFLDELKVACDRGVIIVNCTQCSNGGVAALYDTGKVLWDIGVLPGFDMTPEAALTKLCYVLGKTEMSLEQKKELMQTSLRGELTTTVGAKMEEFDLVDAVARSMHLSTPEELGQMCATLFPAMLNTAVQEGDINKIINLKAYGADLSCVNHDHRTALHLACSMGNFAIVNHLLMNGVSVHIRDHYDRTPLQEAISGDHHDIIQILINCGAHLTGSSRAIGEQLCTAAARGALLRLQSYQLAGADLAQPDPSGRTALHLAALHGHEQVVRFLLDIVDNPKVKDMLDLTPLDYALKGGQQEIVRLLGGRPPMLEMTKEEQ